MSATVGSLLVEIGADVARLRTDMGKAAQIVQNQSRTMSRHLGGINKTANQVSGAISNIGTAMVGLGTGYGIMSMVQEFSDLDKGLVGVKKTTGLAGGELQQLGRDIQKITTELPLTTQELLAIAQSAGQLGVNGHANILKFTKTVGMLGTASDLAGEEAATSLARILNVTSESADQVDVLGSVIVALGNNMATTEKEIARMATEVAQATGVFGVSSAEAAALGATMRSLGIRAELGGSSVGRAFRAIDAAIREGGEQMEALSDITDMTGAQIRQTFQTDATAVFQAFISGLGNMIANGHSAADVLEGFGLKGEEVLKSLPVLAKRSDELGRALGIAAKETANATALTIEAMEASKSFSAQMQMAGSEINITAAAIGRELAPAIVHASKAFSQFVTENRGDFAAFAQDATEFAEDLALIVKHVGAVFSTTVRGWNSLPTVVQEIGIVGALVGGTKARVALALIAAAAGQIDKLNKQAAGVTEIDKTSAVMSQEINRLAVLQERRANLRGNDLETFGPQYDRDIATTEAHIQELQGRIIAARQQAEHDFRNIDRLATQSETKAKHTIVAASGGASSLASGVSSKEYKKDFDSHLKAFQGFQDDKKKALARFSQDYKRITLGETAFAIAEAKARSTQLQALAGEDSKVVAQIKEWEALRIAEINEEAAEKTKNAWEKYADASLDNLKNMDSMASTVGRNLEDSFVSAFTGAEISAEGFFNTIYAEMVRMQVARPLAGAATGFLGDMFSSFFHSGGVVGSGGTVGRVNPLVFAGAPKYHSGGVAGLAPDEVPAILQKGEVVLSRDQVRGASAPGGNLELRVIVQNEDGGNTRMEQAGQDISFDGERWVATTWLKAVRGNVANLRDTLQRGL